MRGVFVTIMALTMVVGCSTGKTARSERTLRAPTGATPAAVAAVDEGNRLYAAEQWPEAKQRYEAAIQAQPTLAEAHYNLALVYDAMRDYRSANQHYIEAANLAPGNKTIWDAPPLREHGDVEARPRPSTGTKFLPALGY